MVIAIDGPAGAGKSTVARAVAEQLGFTYLDTGAMYRAVALAHAERGGEPAAVADQVQISVGERVLLDGRDVTAEIRTAEISKRASQVAADRGVRTALIAKQRAILQQGDWVAEGRDVGSVVAPDAAVKVFLTATEEERAKRRARDLGGADHASVMADLKRRDENDASADRTVLEPAPDATPVDTSGLTIDEVVGQIATLVTEAREIG
jgi:cytidylate kinase